MLICGEYTAIHYDFTTIVGDYQHTGKVMEFVKCYDYGGELGTIVVEGWGSTKYSSYEGLKKYQGPEEKEFKKNNWISTTDLKLKYIDDNAENILNIILEGFDKWHQGPNAYKSWLDTAYDSQATISDLDENVIDINKFKEEIDEKSTKEEITKLFFYNILIRENWAALHYRYRNKNLETNEITEGYRMQFLKFQQHSSSLLIVVRWIQ